MYNAIDRTHEFARLITQLETLLGIPAPAEWARLYDRVTQFQQLDNSGAVARMAAAIQGTDDIEVLLPDLTLAAAIQTKAVLGPVHLAVIGQLFPVLKDIAAQHGRDSHAKLATKFNAAAAKLTASLHLAGPTMTAEQAINADQATQDAYRTRAATIATLDTCHAAMRVCAELTGARVTPDAAASLVINFDNVAPKSNLQVWSHVNGSTLNWQELAAMAVLGARPLGTAASPRHPGLVEKWERGSVGYGRRLFDPVAEAYVG